MTPSARFTAKYAVDAQQCWRWTAATNGDGYARFLVAGRNTLAHRWAYEHFVGPIPAGLTLDHLCRNRACVNPAHLEPVSAAINIVRAGIDIGARYRGKTHCLKGHPFDEANTSTYAYGGTLHRKCLTCGRERVRLANHARGIIGNGYKTECVNGHPFDKANTKTRWRDGTLRRACRTCLRDRARAAYRVAHGPT